MTATAHYRGWPIYYDHTTFEWRYSDSGGLLDDARPCARCGRPPTPEGHDACLGTLPGKVIAACCGHGVEAGYVTYALEDEPAHSGGKIERNPNMLPTLNRTVIHQSDQRIVCRIMQSTEKVTAGALFDMYYSLQKPYRHNAMWLMTKKTLAPLFQIIDGNGDHIVLENRFKEKLYILFGLPVIISLDVLDVVESPVKTILLGDFEYCVRECK